MELEKWRGDAVAFVLKSIACLYSSCCDTINSLETSQCATRSPISVFLAGVIGDVGHSPHRLLLQAGKGFKSPGLFNLLGNTILKLREVVLTDTQARKGLRDVDLAVVWTDKMQGIMSGTSLSWPGWMSNLPLYSNC